MCLPALAADSPKVVDPNFGDIEVGKNGTGHDDGNEHKRCRKS